VSGQGRGSRGGPARERAGRAKVVLVGAGPGDPDLITLRGAEALRGADVVVYDALADPRLLDLAPAHAERIDVGKRGHEHPTRTQEDVNALLVDRARRGRCVVRLKGGDPFVFGRGGEEASACRAAGIPFEVVPGITAALAAPALAGIPVTDRRHAASFGVVTGHKDPTRPAQTLRWDALAAAVDTLVILMGMANLEGIVRELLAVRPPDTPSAAVMWAGTRRQRVVEAPLAELPARVRQAGVGNPATLVVGDVVALRRELAFWEELPLAGRRVLVTRGEDQAGPLIEALEAQGAEAVHLPMLRFVAPRDAGELDACLARLGEYDALLLTSANAARFLARAAAAREVRLDALRGVVLCVGPATAAAARAAGLRVDRTASGRRDGRALLAEVERHLALAGKRLLLPRSQIAREGLLEALREAGARVDAPIAYETLPPDPASPEAEVLRARVGRGDLDVATFTSPSAVRHCLALVGDEGRAALARCTLAAIGATTAGALRAAGLEPDVVPDRPGVAELVAALVDREQTARAALERATPGPEGADPEARGETRRARTGAPGSRSGGSAGPERDAADAADDPEKEESPS